MPTVPALIRSRIASMERVGDCDAAAAGSAASTRRAASTPAANFPKANFPKANFPKANFQAANFQDNRCSTIRTPDAVLRLIPGSLDRLPSLAGNGRELLHARRRLGVAESGRLAVPLRRDRGIGPDAAGIGPAEKARIVRHAERCHRLRAATR